MENFYISQWFDYEYVNHQQPIRTQYLVMWQCLLQSECPHYEYVSTPLVHNWPGFPCFWPVPGPCYWIFWQHYKNIFTICKHIMSLWHRISSKICWSVFITVLKYCTKFNKKFWFLITFTIYNQVSHLIFLLYHTSKPYLNCK